MVPVFNLRETTSILQTTKELSEKYHIKQQRIKQRKVTTTQQNIGRNSPTHKYGLRKRRNICYKEHEDDTMVHTKNSVFNLNSIT